MKQKLIFTNLVGEALDGLVAEAGNPQTVIVADTNTEFEVTNTALHFSI